METYTVLEAKNFEPEFCFKAVSLERAIAITRSWCRHHSYLYGAGFDYMVIEGATVKPVTDATSFIDIFR